MRLTVLIYTTLLMLMSLTAQAQTLSQPGDSTKTNTESPPPRLYMWNVEETLGTKLPMEVDTVKFNFQSTNLVEGMTGHYNYLGNLGSPRLSRLFSERRMDESTTFFLEPFNSFTLRPEQLKFTNSNIPYSNLTYYKAGDKVNGEERFKVYFSVNANKRTSLGFNFDYLYGRGQYSNQGTAHFLANVFASYIGERYEMHAIYNNTYLKMNENGGITDDQYITKPEEMTDGKKSYEASSIPVNMEYAANRNHDFYAFYTHRYHLGFTRRTLEITEKGKATPPGVGTPPSTPGLPEGAPGTPGPLGQTAQSGQPGPPPQNMGQAELPAVGKPEGTEALGDSLGMAVIAMDTLVHEEFIPVTSLIHTIKVERTSHRYRNQSEDSDDYDQTYYQTDSSNDSTTILSIKNTIGIQLLEGFNKYAKAGLTAYLTHTFSRYDLMGDTLGAKPNRISEQELWVGGELSKRAGTTLHYTVSGEIGIWDKAAGQFNIRAKADLNIPFLRDTLNIYARGYLSNTLPAFQLRHYRGNHYAWDNDLSKEWRTRIEGEIYFRRSGTRIRAGVENIKNYTYLNASVLPAQYSSHMQVIDATLTQNFRLGILHLDNEVTWQKTNGSSVLPLPELSLYHNLYLLTTLAHKVLTVQLGADLRYFTSYYAPDYAPALQHFTLQDATERVKIGGYPVVNVYANIHLKRTRLFAMMYHVNAGMGDRNYFFVPHYPLNGRLLKFGLSWNFFD